MAGSNEEKDTEDTSSDDTQESNDTEDTDSNSDDTSQDSGSGNEEDEGDDEEDTFTSKYFHDPNSVPKEQRAAFKRMQASFTRKMQEASFSMEKARAFDNLVRNPGFQQWMEEQQSGAGNKRRQARTNNESEDDDDDAPVTRRSLQNEMQRLLRTQEEDNRRETIQKAWNDFTKDNKDWQAYKYEMNDLLAKHPTLSFQELYNWVKHGSPNGVRDNRKVITDKKKSNQVRKPSNTQGGETQKKGKMSIYDAYQRAKRSLGVGQ